MRLWLQCSAWLCLSLLLWTAAQECTHNHPTRIDAASCAICLAAHSANPALHSAESAPAFATVGVVHEETLVTHLLIESSDLDIRGPPVL